MVWKGEQDAFGREVYDGFLGRRAEEICERDDGWIAVSAGSRMYVSEYEDWGAHQRTAMRYVRGRVLDVGCGGGRVALYLQRKGLDVLGIDNSSLAIETCKLRGLKRARAVSVTGISRRLGVFDTIVMLGNNFGLLANRKRAKWLLRRMGSMTSDRGRIVAESNDPHRTDNPFHLAYHRRNVRRGRMPGQVHIRVRYQCYATPWFDYLLVSKQEMEDILDGTGWRVARYLDSKGSVYIAVIEKRHRPER